LQAVGILTSDGRSHTLSSAPRGATTLSSVGGLTTGARALAGSYFASDSEHDGRLLVSTDHGRTWQEADTGGTGIVTFIEADGGRLYAQLLSNPAVPPRLIASDDGGRTWFGLTVPPLTPVVTQTPDPDMPPVLYEMNLAVLPPGGLLLCDGARTWKLPRGATTFEAIPDDNTLAMIGVPGVVLGIRGDASGATLQTTTDGIHWRVLNVDS
jgi:hypothetical protein